MFRSCGRYGGWNGTGISDVRLTTLRHARVNSRRCMAIETQIPLPMEHDVPGILSMGQSGKSDDIDGGAAARAEEGPDHGLQVSASDNITKFSQLPDDFGTNQHMRINEEFKEKLRSVLWKFRAPIRFAFAYGSGVFKQGAASADKPMVDFIFGVSHTQHWHSLNMQEYPDHYSFLRRFGSRAISNVQDHIGAGVYFNPYVEVNGMMIKYGVVNVDTLCEDLTDWRTLYIAGRMQKPIKILRDEPKVRLSNQINLLSAMRTALLLMPEEFSEYDLYLTIAGISYMGDLRMKLPTENPQKVDNIVSGNFNNFRRLYEPLIAALPNVQFTDPGSLKNSPDQSIKLQQDCDPKRRANMVRRLPKFFRARLYRIYQHKFNLPIMPPEASGPTPFGGEFEMRVAADPELRVEVANAIRSTVGWTSSTQTLKGLLTAGPWRSGRYLLSKGDKWWAGYTKKK